MEQLTRRWSMMARWSPLWLNNATIKAIVAALGMTDGWTLIQNTQTYLDGLYAEGQGTFAHQLANFCNKYPLFARLMLTEYSLQRGGKSLITYEVPKMPEDLTNPNTDPLADNQRLWLMRYGFAYSGWSNPSNIVSHEDWILRQGGFGNGSWYNIIGTYFPKYGITAKDGTTWTIYNTFVRFFIPTALPTGYKGIHVSTNFVINGKSFPVINNPINSIKTIPYDFTDVIKLNEVNYVAITKREGNDAWVSFGFY